MPSSLPLPLPLLLLLLLSPLKASGAKTTCSIDLTQSGYPTCLQECPDWCWATVISGMKQYYLANPPTVPFVRGNNATAKCQDDECHVVSDVRGLSPEQCCSLATECDVGDDACGNASGDDEIFAGLQLEVPSREWTMKPTADQGDFVNGPIPESQIVELLMAGTPIAREIHGHITSLVGCKPDREGKGNVYRVLDSLEDQDDEIWMDFATLVSDYKEGGGRQDGPWETAYW
mmetsp:Transcript_21010/g.39340  ORF Transcript_21010/g.39340 Transcript_21010/m.39340 type:complete len:232 (+) Transcript_21010:112-807(+)